MKNLVIVIVTSVALFACIGEQAASFRKGMSKHEQKEEKFHKRVNRTRDIIENNARKKDSLYRVEDIIENNARKKDSLYRYPTSSLPPYDAPPDNF